MTDEEILRLARAYIAATQIGDVEAMTKMTEPDAVFWHNNDAAEVGVEQTNKTISWLHRTVPNIAWDVVSLLATDEGFVWRSLLTGTAPGGPLRMHTCVVATLSERGRIGRFDEYLDAAGFAVLSG